MYKLFEIHKPSESGNISRGHVLVIYTGGTLGMVYDNKSKSLVPFDFEQIAQNIPEIKRLDFHISVITFDKLLDSSNMRPSNWLEMAKIIEENYDIFDSFVVLHGTDTMAYSASALSFILMGLSKPVIFTGSQLPIGVARTDAKENFITALEISLDQKNGKPIVPEVSIYFNSVLLRGNRARKHESQQFDAFISENYPPLANIGINIEYNLPYIYINESQNLKINRNLDENVGILKLFPGISESFVKSILATKNLRGLIIETFGAGNTPTDEWFHEAIKMAIENEILVVNVSQCIGGKVTQGAYETSNKLNQMGVLGGNDITTEAAICKLMVVLGKKLSYSESQKLFLEDFSGEITVVN
jgi:L-asparaginase